MPRVSWFQFLRICKSSTSLLWLQALLLGIGIAGSSAGPILAQELGMTFSQSPSDWGVRSVSQRNWRLEESLLPTKQVTVDQGSTAWSLLEEYNVRPDPNSIAALYDLNPRLQNLNRMPEGTLLIVPDATGLDLGVDDTSGSVAILPALHARRAIRDNIEAIESFSIDAENPNPARIELHNMRSRALEAYRPYIDQTVPAPQAVADLVARETQFVTAIINGDGYSAEQLQYAQEVLRVAETRRAQIDDGGDGSVSLCVSTLKKTSNEPVPMLRVYLSSIYIPYGEKPSPLSGVTSPVRQRVAVADYKVWAENDDGPVSVPIVIKADAMRMNNPMTVDLVVDNANQVEIDDARSHRC